MPPGIPQSAACPSRPDPPRSSGSVAPDPRPESVSFTQVVRFQPSSMHAATNFFPFAFYAYPSVAPTGLSSARRLSPRASTMHTIQSCSLESCSDFYREVASFQSKVVCRRYLRHILFSTRSDPRAGSLRLRTHRHTSVPSGHASAKYTPCQVPSLLACRPPIPPANAISSLSYPSWSFR